METSTSICDWPCFGHYIFSSKLSLEDYVKAHAFFSSLQHNNFSKFYPKLSTHFEALFVFNLPPSLFPLLLRSLPNLEDKKLPFLLHALLRHFGEVCHHSGEVSHLCQDIAQASSPHRRIQALFTLLSCSSSALHDLVQDNIQLLSKPPSSLPPKAKKKQRLQDEETRMVNAAACLGFGYLCHKTIHFSAPLFPNLPSAVSGSAPTSGQHSTDGSVAVNPPTPSGSKPRSLSSLSLTSLPQDFAHAPLSASALLSSHTIIEHLLAHSSSNHPLAASTALFSLLALLKLDIQQLISTVSHEASTTAVSAIIAPSLSSTSTQGGRPRTRSRTFSQGSAPKPTLNIPPRLVSQYLPLVLVLPTQLNSSAVIALSSLTPLGIHSLVQICHFLLHPAMKEFAAGHAQRIFGTLALIIREEDFALTLRAAALARLCENAVFWGWKYLQEFVGVVRIADFLPQLQGAFPENTALTILWLNTCIAVKKARALDTVGRKQPFPTGDCPALSDCSFFFFLLKSCTTPALWTVRKLALEALVWTLPLFAGGNETVSPHREHEEAEPAALGLDLAAKLERGVLNRGGVLLSVGVAEGEGQEEKEGGEGLRERSVGGGTVLFDTLLDLVRSELQWDLLPEAHVQALFTSLFERLLLDPLAPPYLLQFPSLWLSLSPHTVDMECVTLFWEAARKRSRTELVKHLVLVLTQTNPTHPQGGTILREALGYVGQSVHLLCDEYALKYKNYPHDLSLAEAPVNPLALTLITVLTGLAENASLSPGHRLPAALALATHSLLAGPYIQRFLTPTLTRLANDPLLSPALFPYLSILSDIQSARQQFLDSGLMQLPPPGPKALVEALVKNHLRIFTHISLLCPQLYPDFCPLGIDTLTFIKGYKASA